MSYGALKRKRGPGHSVLQVAQTGGDPARSSYVKSLQSMNPAVGKRIAQSSLFMPRGRSGVRHVLKTEGMKDKFAARNKMHHHDVMRKYYRGKVSNGIKSHIMTYASTQ
jgi:hypothetical protein